MKNLTTEEQRIADASRHIIKFEGYPMFESNGYEQVMYNKDDSNTRCLIDTGYHEDVDRWLKPVLRLIRKKGFKATLIGRHCTISADGNIFKSPQRPNNDAESVWIPVVEFCKWYNETHKTNLN